MEDGADKPNKPNSVETAHEQRFSAFISYSHADAAAVRRLHSQIESYRLPKGLGHIDALNGRQDKIGRVFRDREDLSAAQDLSVAVKDALGRSEVLVVACSPDAKASQWVDQEIAYFRERHPDRPILAAILRGEPAEAFPAALTQGGTEPLAADLRKQGDGWRLGFLKVVAGIVGVPLDRLVQRDTQRQMRRVMAVTGLVAVIAIAMGVMTMIALQARNEARFQRDEADGLVAYMMTDLRQQLKSVGRLDVMRSVNTRALNYYTNYANLSVLTPQSLERRVGILQAIGEDLEKTGDLDGALDNFLEAQRITENLVSREPSNPDRMFAHARSEYWIGFAKQKSSNHVDAISAYERSRSFFERAAENGFDRNAVLKEVGWIENAIGVVYLQGLGENDKAATHFERYLAAFEELHKLNVAGNTDLEATYSLADAHAWLAQVYHAQNKNDEASDLRKKQIAILDRLLAGDPKNDSWLWAVIGANRDLFRLCFKTDQLRCAETSIAEAQSLLDHHLADESNRDWLWQSAYVALDSGFLAIARGDTVSATQALRDGQGFFARYRDASEGDREAVRQLEQTVEALQQKLAER